MFYLIFGVFLLTSGQSYLLKVALYMVVQIGDFNVFKNIQYV